MLPFLCDFILTLLKNLIHQYILCGARQIIESDSNDTINEHGIQQRRGLTLGHYSVTPIPDLRPGLDSPSSSTASNKPPFQGLCLQENRNL